MITFMKSKCGGVADRSWSAGLLFAVFALSACGGGGGSGTRDVEDMDGSGPTVGTYAAFADTTATAETVVRYVSIDNAQISTQQNSGVLDHVGGTISTGFLAGTLNAGRTEIVLTGGGTATLTNPASTEYMRFFQTSGTGNDQFGVVGQPTDVQDMPPSGSSTYNGRVRMDVSTNDGPYALTGAAVITANWNNDIDTRFQGLSGVRNENENVTISGSISMRDAPLSGTSFSGGTLETTGSFFDTDSTPATTHNGQFFGPNADEVGGTFTLLAPDLNISAVFSAE